MYRRSWRVVIAVFSLALVSTYLAFYRSRNSPAVKSGQYLVDEERAHFREAPAAQGSHTGVVGEDGGSELAEDMAACSVTLGMERDRVLIKNFEQTVQSANKLISDFCSVVPKSFLQNYKNPCWFSKISPKALPSLMSLDTFNSAKFTKTHLDRMKQTVFEEGHSKNHLLCLPYFFIAGFPKSATTNLDSGIRKHHHIIGPETKEPHWWTRGVHTKEGGEELGTLSVARYSLFFKPLSDVLASSSETQLLTYDGSQSTLWDSSVSGDSLDYCALPAIMSRFLPNAKFVVLMRDPTERLISHCIWSCKYHLGSDVNKWPPQVINNGPDIFHEQVVELVDWFERCTESLSLYECVSARRFGLASNLTNTCGQVGHRLGIGLYHVHIRKWLQFFPKEQFLFLRMEDLTGRAFETVNELTDFLGISPISKMEANQWFSEKVNQRTQQQEASFRMKEVTISLLRRFYRAHNELLAQMLGDNKFLWNEHS